MSAIEPQPQPCAEVFVQRRYRCPFCRRSWSHRTVAVKHIARCWYNPAARSCKTCIFYSTFMGDESCFADVDLSIGVLPIGCVEWGGPR